MIAQRLLTAAVIVLFNIVVIGYSGAAETKDAAEKPKPVTTDDPYVAVEDLELILPALSKEELLIEAEGWQKILRKKAIEIGKLEIVIKRQNREIARAEDIHQQAQKAIQELRELEVRADTAQQTGEAEAIRKTGKTAEQAQEIVTNIADMIDEAVDAAKETAKIRDIIDVKDHEGIEQTIKAAEEAEAALEKVQQAVGGADPENPRSVRDAGGTAKEAAQEAQEATSIVEENVDKALESVHQPADKTEIMKTAQSAMKQLQASKKEEKEGLLQALVTLREQRRLIIDNIRAVLTELALKTDAGDSTTLAKLNDYRLYVRGVEGIHLDVTDTTSSWMTIKGWFLSPEGGMRFAVNFLRFIGILVAAWFAALIGSRLFRRALNMTPNVSMLLKDFLVGSARWTIMVVGVIMALAALEVSITPLLAMMGAAGFIIALAMQDSLSNFASGIMILFFRPFDVGDFIDAGGVSGKVTSVNLVSTLIMTVDNKKMFVPNNKIWRDVITNATGVRTRRVDLEFGIGYDADIDKAEEILENIVSNHPMVLKSPEPNIRLHLLADSSVNFICRPWTLAGDYWDVYWDITKTVKQEFDAAGIKIPFPQQDVHLFVENDPEKQEQTESTDVHENNK